MEQALRERIASICERTGWTPAQAYKCYSLAVDFRVTQNVNAACVWAAISMELEMRS
jgi:acetamidase/formamidase